MSVTNSIVDFFQGNPFNNPIGSLIEKATDSKNECENWTLYMEICDEINGTEDGPRLAIRAIRRLISTEINKNNLIVLYSLTLLEVCVKNCGYRFHLLVSTRDFLQEFDRLILMGSNTLINGRPDIPMTIRDKILQLIQSWFDSFRGQPDLKEVTSCYYRYLEAGIEFPAQDVDKMSPINLPKKTSGNDNIVMPSNLSSSASPSFDSSKGDNSAASVTKNIVDQAKVTPQKQTIKTKKTHIKEPIKFEKFVEKLSTELQSVQGNVEVFKELMDEYPIVLGEDGGPDKGSSTVVPDEALTLMANLNAVCREMHDRLMQLINNWEDQLINTDSSFSSLLPELLRINDELNSALARYERYERRMGIADGNDKPTNQNADDDLLLLTSENPGEAKLIEAVSEVNVNDSVSAIPKTEQGAMSSQEFDQFLNERSLPINDSNATETPIKSEISTQVIDNSLPAPTNNPDYETNTNSKVNKTKSSELFDL